LRDISPPGTLPLHRAAPVVLRPGDVTAAGSRHPEVYPFLLPEPERENPPEKARELFLPPGQKTEGLWVWLVESSPGAGLEVDQDTIEALHALGYVGP
jgi:hypothetical protein